jgi:hypothetical protein
MLKKLSAWMTRVSNGWVALSTLIIFLLFTAFVLPGQSSRAAVNTGSAKTPDLSLYYTADELYQMAEAYGGEGRVAYVRARFTFDLVWPLVYMIFLSTEISWVYGKAFAMGSPWRLTNLTPIFGAVFDYLENIFTSLVMIVFPKQVPVVGMLAGLCTVAKWMLLGTSFILLLYGIAVGIWRYVRTRKPR